MIYVLISALLAAVYGLLSYSRERANHVMVLYSGLTVFLTLCLINYFAMPVLSPWGYFGIWVELLLVSLLASLVYPNKDDADWRPLVPCVIVLFMIIAGFCSSTILQTKAYQKMLNVQEVEYKNFATDVNVIPVEKLIVADYSLARKVVEDRLEENPGLGSRCIVGNMTLQNLNGSFTINDGKVLTFENELVWVAPLEHSGFWKWVLNSETPGYMLVYANDPTKNFLITEVNGEQLRMRYLESACFGKDIERHIRTNGFCWKGITEHNFEIDGNGQPYWVLCHHDRTIGFGGRDATGVITVNIQSGELKQYDIANAPQWIDHIQPEEFITEQLTYWGSLKNGWLNSIWAQQDVQIPTPGTVLVYSEGHSYWYTGMQSSGGDTATSGFVLVNTRTKEAKYYRIAGVNEQEAQRIVEDQNFAKAARYSATAPVLYNVRGIPTYFMTLKGQSGNVTGYAFLAVINRQVVGVGASKREAETNYLHSLRRMRNDTIVDGPVMSENKQTLTVRDIVVEGNVYYILFNEIPGKEFTGLSEFYRELKWTKPGHRTLVNYSDGESKIIPLDSFDNLDFDI